MDGQTSLPFADAQDRSGVAEEAELVFVSTGAISDTIRGLQMAASLDVDVVHEQFGGADATCDGTFAEWEDAVYDAHLAGTDVELVLTAA